MAHAASVPTAGTPARRESRNAEGRGELGVRPRVPGVSDRGLHTHKFPQVQPQLLGHKGNELLRRVLARSKTLTGMAQQAELDREAEAVRCTAFGPDERQVVGTKDVVPRHLGALNRDSE